MWDLNKIKQKALSTADALREKGNTAYNDLKDKDKRDAMVNAVKSKVKDTSFEDIKAKTTGIKERVTDFAEKTSKNIESNLDPKVLKDKFNIQLKESPKKSSSNEQKCNNDKDSK